MASLGEVVPVCRLSNDSDLLSVNESGLSGHLLVTLKSKFINLYKIDDQKVVSSWSLRHMQNVTSPTVWCNLNQQYMTVIDNKIIHTWKVEDMEFQKSKRKNFKFDIHRVVAIGDWEPVIVCSNGQVEFLSNIKHSYKDSEKKTDIIYCDAKLVNDSLCVVCLIHKEDDILEVQSHWCKGNESPWSKHITHIDLPRGQMSFSCSCLVESTEIKLYTMCCSDSDSVLYCTCHSEGSYSAGSTYQLKPITGTDRKSAIVCIDSTHVAVSGITKNSQRGIGIYDTKFGTLQSWTSLPDTDTSYKIFCHHGYLFTACGKSVLSFSYQCQPSSLASIFQRHKTQEVKTNENESTFIHHSWNKKKSSSQENNEAITALFSKLCNRKETSTHKDFCTSFRQLMAYVNRERNVYLFDTELMKNLVNRCLTEEKFWPCEELKTLIAFEHFPVSFVPQLFDKLVLHLEIDVMNAALKILPEIPESCLCKALHCYLGSENKIEKMESDSPGKESTVKICPLKRETANMINQVLILPYNDVFLVECLKKLSFHDVLLLLEYLYYLLGDSENDEEEDSSEVVKLSMLQVVNWLCLIIDAHITQLIISPDARILLINLHSVVESLVEFYNDLVSLDALLQQLKVKSAIHQQPKVGQYCIEVLHVQ